jgi:hypothetical protein
MKKKSNVCFMSRFRAGDEVLFRFDGLLPGKVERVSFEGRKVRYQLTLTLECEVPDSLIVEDITPTREGVGFSLRAQTKGGARNKNAARGK